MTSYLGPLGALVPVGEASSLSPSSDIDVTFETTMGGRVTSNRALNPTRTWGFSTSGADYPSEVANLAAFVAGEFGYGPWRFADEWAQNTNLLTPRDSMLELPWTNTTLGGQVSLGGDQVAGRHLIVSDAGATSFSVSPTDPLAVIAPVVPGLPVTVSAWLNTSGASIRASVRDVSGTILDTITATAVSNGWQRRSQTITAPPNAAYVRLYVTGGGRVARPAVTWTSEVVDWHVGQGCAKALVTSFGQNVTTAWGRAGGQMLQASTTIYEVG